MKSLKIINPVALSIILLIMTSCGGKNNPTENSIRIAVEFTTHSACAHIAKQKGWY